MKKNIFVAAVILVCVCFAGGVVTARADSGYLQNDLSTCGCDNPMTPGYDECYVAGAACSGGYIQSSGSSSCGCDNPTTGGNECPPQAGDVCYIGTGESASQGYLDYDGNCICENVTTPLIECPNDGGGGGTSGE